MADLRFYRRAGPFTLAELAKLTGSKLGPDARASFAVNDVAALADADAAMLVHLDSAKYRGALGGRSGYALIARERDCDGEVTRDRLINTDPQRAFAEAAWAFYPPELQRVAWSAAPIDPSARIAEGAAIAPGAIIGPLAEIGERTRIGPNAVIGAAVRIGRDCSIAANASIAYAILGDRVIVHPGSAIGQDGFGYVGSARGHFKIPQLGRVIIQDDVEIGACVAIDRGALGDTMIGAGTKIDNLVQIGHNCRIGRHVVIVAQVGISGSVTIDDFVVLGGQVGIADHLKIGAGARIAAQSGVIRDVPPGVTYAGLPARPRMQWLREVAWLTKNVKNKEVAKEPKASGEET